ncbi:MAG: flagellar biosynthetic protein FliQ [Thermohalobaculum sp.]
MDEFRFIGLMRDAVWVGITISAPVLGVALTVGLAIGLLQALTSIQELTLTFVPKLMAILLVFWLSLAFMGQGLITFFQIRIIPLVAGG